MFLEIWIIKSNMERNCLQTKKEHYIYYKKFIGPSSEQRKIIYWRVLFKRLQNSWRQILWRSYNILNFPKWNIFKKRSKGMFLIFEIVCIPSYFITSLIYVVIGDQSSFLIAVKIIRILDWSLGTKFNGWVRKNTNIWFFFHIDWVFNNRASPFLIKKYYSAIASLHLLFIEKLFCFQVCVMKNMNCMRKTTIRCSLHSD